MVQWLIEPLIRINIFLQSSWCFIALVLLFTSIMVRLAWHDEVGKKVGVDQVCLLAILVLQLVPRQFAAEQFNAKRYSMIVASAILIYFSLASVNLNRLAVLCFSWILSAWGGCIALVQIIQTRWFLIHAWIQATDAVNYRGFLPTLGLTPRIDVNCLLVIIFSISVFIQALTENLLGILAGTITTSLIVSAVFAGLLRANSIGLLVSVLLTYTMLWRIATEQRRKRWTLFFVASFFVAVLTLTATGLRPAVAGVFQTHSTKTSTRSFEGRTALWQGYLEMIRQHPLLGVGGLNAPLVMLQRNNDRPFVSRAYNPILQVALQNGVLGLVMFLLCLVCWGVSLLRSLKSTNAPRWKRELACITFGGMFGVICGDFTSGSVLINAPAMYAFLAMFAISCNLVPKAEERVHATPACKEK